MMGRALLFKSEVVGEWRYIKVKMNDELQVRVGDEWQ